jgi:hypothetical protein
VEERIGFSVAETKACMQENKKYRLLHKNLIIKAGYAVPMEHVNNIFSPVDFDNSYQILTS